jgi:phospholipid-binding lipoprotein MlaA
VKPQIGREGKVRFIKLSPAILLIVLITVVASRAENVPVAEPEPSGEQGWSDPLSGFNSAMFWFNLRLDDYFLHPVASGYAKVVPQTVRVHIGEFFDNVNVLPRFANNLFQFRLKQAGSEVARFGINSTLGVAGFFDPAGSWLGLKEYPDDFGLTMGRYGVGMGPYLVLPFFGPSTIRDALGRAADGAMNPLSYLVPWYVSVAATGGEDVGEAVNYRSLNLTLFEDVDRYAIDLYGAVQDGYLQERVADLKEIKGQSPTPGAAGNSAGQP